MGRGYWLIHRDSGAFVAQAISGHGDTIAGLAETIGLGAEDSQWPAWLHVGGLLEREPGLAGPARGAHDRRRVQLRGNPDR